MFTAVIKRRQSIQLYCAVDRGIWTHNTRLVGGESQTVGAEGGSGRAIKLRAWKSRHSNFHAVVLSLTHC